MRQCYLAIVRHFSGGLDLGVALVKAIVKRMAPCCWVSDAAPEAEHQRA